MRHTVFLANKTCLNSVFSLLNLLINTPAGSGFNRAQRVCPRSSACLQLYSFWIKGLQLVRANYHLEASMLLAKLPPSANHSTFKLQPAARQTQQFDSLFDEMTSVGRALSIWLNAEDTESLHVSGETQTWRASVNKDHALNHISVKSQRELASAHVS